MKFEFAKLPPVELLLEVFVFVFLVLLLLVLVLLVVLHLLFFDEDDDFRNGREFLSSSVCFPSSVNKPVYAPAVSSLDNSVSVSFDILYSCFSLLLVLSLVLLLLLSMILMFALLS